MPQDYVLPTGQNQGQNPSIYTGVGPGLVGLQTYAPANSFLRKDGNWALPTGYINASATTQTPIAATRTYLAGSSLTFVAGQLQVGTIFRWKFNMTKTNAGTATSTIDVAFGTAGTTADTAILSFTKPAGTAVADEGWVEIEAIIKANSATVGVVTGEFRLIHNLAATGHAQIPCVVVNAVSSSFNTFTPTTVGVCITTGASDAITIDAVTADASKLLVV